jgi:hypothetical protein
MTDDLDEYDTDFFHEAVTRVASHPDWEYADSNEPMEDIAAGATEFHFQNYFDLDHTETDGTLKLHAAHLTRELGAIGGTLEQPVDQEQHFDPDSGTFGHRLAEAYQSIAEENEEGYVTADATPLKILNFHVPLDYEDDTLQDSLSAASAASREVQELNDEIEQAINRRI